MIAGKIAQFEDLQQISGYTRAADVIKWADENGIRWKYSRNGIWTTVDALNAALGLDAAAANEAYDDDLVA
ncbi:hypothetical protein [Aquilutibacter rugosus]|uniref:hypothetical protein n=1 Tax=Aquilutibacter rugosus TaxID=3115820 RepID=UPI002F3F3F17